MGKTIGMWADAKLEERILRRCAAEKISASELVRRAVERYLEKEGGERAEESVLKEILTVKGFVIGVARHLYRDEVVDAMEPEVERMTAAKAKRTAEGWRD
jgi:Arc/MetJ-type ribon-helix-helix transcriptional regulator